MSEEELEELRKRRMYEMQQRLVQEQQQMQVQQQIETKKQDLLRRILTTKARQRLTNLKMVKSEFVNQIELQFIQLAQQGKVNIPITDKQLKEMLSRLQTRQREIKIRRL